MVVSTFRRPRLISDSSQRGVNKAHTIARKLKMEKVNIVSTARPWCNSPSQPVAVLCFKTELINAKKPVTRENRRKY